MTDERDLTTKDVPTVNVTLKYLDALRQAVGLHIDPETAEVDWFYAQALDPYGDFPNFPEECGQMEWQYFARSPGGDVWISFCDLPEATRDALWKRRYERQGLRPEELWDEDEVPF